MVANRDQSTVLVNEDTTSSTLSNYFKQLNQHSIARKLIVNKKNAEGLPITSQDSIDSLLEFIGKGEILFDEELQESQQTNKRTSCLFGMYKIVLDAKFRLVEVVKSDPRFTKSNKLFVVPAEIVKKAKK